MSVEIPAGEPDERSGRLARLRARGERAGDRYLELAQRRPLLGFPLTFVARYTSRQGVLLASAAAFRLFLWLIPLAVLLAGLLAAFATGQSSDLRSATKTAGITGAASQQVVSALQESHRSWVLAVLIGAGLFLWTTRTLMRNLAIVNAHAWQVPLPKRRQKDVLITTAIFVGEWIVVFAAAAATKRVDNWHPAGVVLGVVLLGLVVAGAWLLTCRRLPDRRDSWIDLIPGCLVFGLGLAALHAFSLIYLPHRLHTSSELYGPLGIAVVILGYLLIIGHLIVSAAVINSIWAEYRAQRRPGVPA